MNTTKTQCTLGYYDSYKENDGGHVAWVTDRVTIATVEVQEANRLPVGFTHSDVPVGVEWQPNRYGWDGYVEGRKAFYLWVE